MLETRFPRLPGDIGNPDSFPFPVLYETVPGARVRAVVRRAGPDPAVAEAIVAAARTLETAGARLIATSCGFLAGLQDRLQVACTVPVLTSALVQLPWLRTLYGPSVPIGVLTFDSRQLSARHFDQAVAGPVAVAGLEGGRELYPVISENRTALDPRRAEADALAATRELVAREPELAAILLECTNLSPYRDRIAEAAGRPVFDLITAVSMVARAHGA